jgi:hypothetical protein
MKKSVLQLLLFTYALTFVSAQEYAQVSAALEKDLIDPKSMELAQTTTTWVSTSSNSSKNDGWGFGSFILGLILIPFSLVLIWKNEKKIVMYHRVILQA